MPKRKAKRPSGPAAALKLFSDDHPELELHKRNQRDLSRFLVYWAVEVHGAIAMHSSLLSDLFNALDLNPPVNPSDTLAKLRNDEELVKTDVGYRPSAHLKE